MLRVRSGIDDLEGLRVALGKKWKQPFANILQNRCS